MPGEKRSPSFSEKPDLLSKDRPLKTTEEFDCERRGYKLTKNCLGTGAYAKVKLAYVSNAKLEKDKRLADELREKGTNKVAIKIISRKHAPKEYVKKFMPREIETLHATYRSPHVTQLYETFRTESRVYLIMEYASKGDLLEYINSRSGKTPGIGEAKAKEFFKQLVAGLLHCHRRNVVHRDLKCENILLDEESETIKISDFGFATRFPTNKQNLLETFCGSYAYAAPEILQAEKYDGKIADIWSLGIILFAMVNGRLPYNDRDIRTLLEQTKTKPRFSSRVQVTPECQDIVAKILTADFNKRPTLNDIIRHEWMTVEIPTENNHLRGIPDGKSNEVVLKETPGDVPKYNLTPNKKVICKPYTQRVLNRERCKVPQEPQPPQKLRQASPRHVDTSPRPGKSGDADVLSKYWEDRKKTDKSRKAPPAPNVLPYKYHGEPVITKIAFRSGTASALGENANVETAYRLSPNRNPAGPSSGCSSASKKVTDLRSLTGKKAGKEITCTLPPVCDPPSKNKKMKSSSAPAQQGQTKTPEEMRDLGKTKTRQASVDISKQPKPRPMQNILFSSPGGNMDMGLQRNWQQKMRQVPTAGKVAKPEIKGKHPMTNIELTYYTLSGKEVNVRDDQQRSVIKETINLRTAKT